MQICVNYGAEADYDAFIATMRDQELYGKHNVVFDPVGGQYAEAAFRAMAPEGRYVVFGFASGGTNPADSFPVSAATLGLICGCCATLTGRPAVAANRTSR